MVQYEKSHLESAFLALADSTRRGVLEHLGRQEASITELAERFHMTLTGQVPEERAEVMKAILTERFAAFTGRPLHISGLAVFSEEARGAPFKVHTWLPLAGAKS